MIDSMKGNLMTLVEAANACPRIRGKKVHSLSVWRWATKGLKGVKLEHVRVGRNICTTEAALNAFFHSVANAAPAAVRPPTPKASARRNEKQRERDIEKARARLAARGMLPKESER